MSSPPPRNFDNPTQTPFKAKLVILGATGDGKSSLGNFILNKKDLFTVSDDPESETKETIGHNGIEGAEDIFVIDTPGLQDTKNSDKKHIVNMVNYVKNHKDIQAIIVVFNFNQDRFAPYLKTMIKIFNDIFIADKFWYHVGFVFTKYYQDMRKKFEKKKEKKMEKYIGQIRQLVEDCKREAPNNFKTFFIDSDMDDLDPESIEECKRLIGWVSSLEPLDTSNAKEVDDKIKSIEKETREIEGPSRWKGNIEFKTIIKMEREKHINYDGSITYSEDKEIDRTEKEIKHKKELVNSRFEEKEEPSSKWEGKKEIITTKYMRRKILTYNDGSTEEGEWEEYKAPKVETIDHPKNLKNVKDEFQNYNENGYKITKQRKTRIYDDGSIEEGEWEIVSKVEIPQFEQGRVIESIKTETKKELRQDYKIENETKSYKTGLIFKDTHYYETQKIIPVTREETYERTVTYYKDGKINHGEWRLIKN